MTIADHIREETLLNFARTLAEKGFDVSFIADVTDLSLSSSVFA